MVQGSIDIAPNTGADDTVILSATIANQGDLSAHDAVEVTFYGDMIDDVRIYDSVLSDEEIGSLVSEVE